MAQFAIDGKSTVVDVGAGTGKFTRLLRPTGARIVAIEPVAAMRRQFATAVPGVEIMDGTAEAIPLPGSSADVATAAQAFHWFANAPALHEIHRVLRPDGGLGLIWNRRDLADPLQGALEAVIRPYRGEAPAHESDDWRQALLGNPLFRPAGERRFRLEQPADQQGVVDRVTSTSFIASLDEPNRGLVVSRVREIVPGGTQVVLRYVTDVFLFTRQ